MVLDVVVVVIYLVNDIVLRVERQTLFGRSDIIKTCAPFIENSTR
jgi:hypothetical protein